MTITYIPFPEKSGFLLWLRSLSPEYRVSLGIEESEIPTWLNKPFPRFVVGLYLSNRFNQFVTVLRRKGFLVDVRRLTKVTSILPKDDFGVNGYELDLDRKSKAFARNLFVATGHWTSTGSRTFHTGFLHPFHHETSRTEPSLEATWGYLAAHYRQ